MTPAGAFEVVRVDGCSAEAAEILAELPEWFGRPESTQEYVAAAGRLPGYLVRSADGRAVGFVVIERRFAASAEVHVMAVRRAWHRRGVGHALLAAVERDLAHDGVRLLSVKTLGPSDADVPYGRTRQFYEQSGFLPIEETMDLWPETPCLIMVKVLGPAQPQQADEIC